MKNVLTTIPKSKYPTWEKAEAVLKKCDGSTRWAGGHPWFWLVNVTALPKHSGTGAVCFMIFDGQVRGYFDIVDTDLTENYRGRHGIGKKRNTQSLILANWHPIPYIPFTGFQGYRYTELKP
jgi:hypothetical protein